MPREPQFSPNSGRSARLPTLRLHKPSGRAVVTIGGRDLYLGEHGTPEAARNYETVIADWLGNGRTLPAELARRDAVVEPAAAGFDGCRCFAARQRRRRFHR